MIPGTRRARSRQRPGTDGVRRRAPRLRAAGRRRRRDRAGRQRGPRRRAVLELRARRAQLCRATACRSRPPLFRMDFENQIVPASVAGGVGATLTSAGETLQQGLEFAGEVQSTAFVEWPVEAFARLSYTWLADAEYAGERYSSIPGFTTVKVTGNRLPYAPEHLLAGTVGAAHCSSACGVELEGVYTSSAFTDDLNTVDDRGRTASAARSAATRCGT
ncbi:MAG: TonB-dependent receptor [Desulfobacterales bacterium]|nr:TonB-dependent receptor [Desulfobacterales bacterium]